MNKASSYVMVGVDASDLNGKESELIGKMLEEDSEYQIDDNLVFTDFNKCTSFGIELYSVCDEMTTYEAKEIVEKLGVALKYLYDLLPNQMDNIKIYIGLHSS